MLEFCSLLRDTGYWVYPKEATRKKIFDGISPKAGCLLLVEGFGWGLGLGLSISSKLYL